MKKITAEEFHKMIENNPSVFEQWNIPLKIIGFIHCNDSPITHLSKYLTFDARTLDGGSATFARCKNLKTATGTFPGFVSFYESHIEKIKDLHITGKNKKGISASFERCRNLKIATGHYAGFVSFWESGIETIHNLHIQNENPNINYASFLECPNLKNLSELDLTKLFNIEPEKLEAEIKRRKALQKFHTENHPNPLPFL
jgi:hypothetical protein